MPASRNTILMALLFLAGSTTHGLSPTGAPDPLGFSGIEVHAFKPGTSCLRLADLNGDGLTDIIFFNPRESRLEVLLRRGGKQAADTDMPRLEQVFDVCGVVVNQDIEDIQLVDLDGDSRLDILAFGRPLGLQRFRINAEGKPQPPEDIFLDTVTDVRSVDVGDLDGDNRPDLVVFRDKAVDILWNDGSSAMPRRSRLPLSEERTTRGKLADVDGNGSLDMILFLKPPGNPIAVRRGDAKGSFGPEIPVDCSRGESIELLRNMDNGEPRLVSVTGGGSSLRLSRFCLNRTPRFFDTASSTPVRFCLLGTDKDVPPWLTTDTNGDGYDDLLVAAPELSAIHVYTGTANGLAATPVTIDSLAGISSMARLSDGSLLAVSRPEKAAGLHAAGHLADFPEILKLPGDALVCTALGQRGYLVCRKGDSYSLVTVEPGGKVRPPLPLPGVLNDPRRALAVPLDGGTVGLLLFAEFAEPRMFRITAKTATPVEPSAFRPLGQTLKPELVGSVNDHGTNLIVVCANRTARGYAWTGEHFDVVRQYNPGDKQADLIGACGFGPLSGKMGLLTLDRAGHNLLWFGPDAAPRRLRLQADIADVEGLAPLMTPVGPHLALIGRSSANLLSSGTTTITAGVCADYQTSSKDPRFTHVFPAGVGRGRPVLAAVDGANNTVELLEAKNGALANRLTFKVFEAPNLISTREPAFVHEPHDLASGDLNRDGILDIVMLCQDRLIIYFGE